MNHNGIKSQKEKNEACRVTNVGSLYIMERASDVAKRILKEDKTNRKNKPEKQFEKEIIVS